MLTGDARRRFTVHSKEESAYNSDMELEHLGNSSFLGRSRRFLSRYVRHISTAAFVAGFLFDNLTLTRIDAPLTEWALGTHLSLATLGILLFQVCESGFVRCRAFLRLGAFLPIVIQFSFGALASGFFIFFSRSGTLATSYPFLLFLGALLIGNEILRTRYARLAFQLAVFFVMLLSFSALFVPVFWGKMGAGIFLASAALALIVFRLFLLVLSWIAGERLRQSRRAVFLSVWGIAAFFVVLYFWNIIPPIPLSVKHIGVYHTVERKGSDYRVSFEQEKSFFLFDTSSRTFHARAGEPVYVFSSVFAPTKLQTTIFHEWYYYDAGEGKWRLASRIPFAIVGGRDAGYRVWSMKTEATPGQWRVDVVTSRGQIVGRLAFTVVPAATAPKLITALR